MTLYLVRHQHDPAHCPAADPTMRAPLRHHLGGPDASPHGVEVTAEAVVPGEHTFYLVVESGDQACLRAFLAPFAAAGSVEVYPASSHPTVTASGGCGATRPALDRPVPALDPERACRAAIDAGLVVHRAHPLNCETAIPALIGGVVMPSAHFYVRNHFTVPDLDASSWRLTVAGLVARPLSLGLHDLHTMHAQTQVVTLECAGNGRALLRPSVAGEPWGLGAVSTAEWTGVPLTDVLQRAGARAEARQVLFRGADAGRVDGRPGTVRFERSLPLDDARGRGALLAYAMNGEPLPVQHGYPVRLVVPGWYGVASVKWLTEIELVAQAFAGYFQADRYVYRYDDPDATEPVTLQRVRALITDPGPGQELHPGALVVRGVAWSGHGPIRAVEVSIGDGPWRRARLLGAREQHGWRWWERITRCDTPGITVIRARASDRAGHTQPEQPQWNRLGYGNNAIQEVHVRIRHPAPDDNPAARPAEGVVPSP
ncbi:sulfite oxidase [Pseudonocardia sp. RS11V-5]|uniref:sulfite oxidase n=1 Tax=Pseudonocardia terrae TaxID=2905831 RepID=UPI001E4635C2|nr:sulfite oxidase [Pseudonocardia terrae]MCE3555481.1 sulfite oxidase [Pseudonocardia terrae]